MVLDLSSIWFTDQDDIVPESGYDEQILNTGIVDTYAGNDRITGTDLVEPYGFKNEGILNTADGDDIITGNVIHDSYPNSSAVHIINWAALNTGEGDDLIDGSQGNGYAAIGIDNTGTLNAGGGDDTITGAGIESGIRVETGTLNMGEGNDLINASGGYWGIGHHALGRRYH